MKKVLLPSRAPKTPSIDLSELDHDAPILAKKKGNIWGVVTKDPQGWIIRMADGFGSRGHFKERLECMQAELSDVEFVTL